jgi:hypothetical protein
VADTLTAAAWAVLEFKMDIYDGVKFADDAPAIGKAIEALERAALAAHPDPADVHEVADVARPEPTEAMVTAYLTANDAYWKRIDGEPTKLGKWRNGTPSEATMVSLRAALAAGVHEAAALAPHAAHTAAQTEVIAALVSALGAMLTHMGMDEDEWNKPTFDQARAAIAKANGAAA